MKWYKILLFLSLLTEKKLPEFYQKKTKDQVLPDFDIQELLGETRVIGEVVNMSVEESVLDDYRYG